MFILAHNDPIWIALGAAIGVLVGLYIVLNYGTSKK